MIVLVIMDPKLSICIQEKKWLRHVQSKQLSGNCVYEQGRLKKLIMGLESVQLLYIFTELVGYCMYLVILCTYAETLAFMTYLSTFHIMSRMTMLQLCHSHHLGFDPGASYNYDIADCFCILVKLGVNLRTIPHSFKPVFTYFALIRVYYFPGTSYYISRWTNIFYLGPNIITTMLWTQFWPICLGVHFIFCSFNGFSIIWLSISIEKLAQFCIYYKSDPPFPIKGMQNLSIHSQSGIFHSLAQMCFTFQNYRAIVLSFVKITHQYHTSLLLFNYKYKNNKLPHYLQSLPFHPTTRTHDHNTCLKYNIHHSIGKHDFPKHSPHWYTQNCKWLPKFYIR